MAVTIASCFQSIFRVTVESVQGNQVYLERTVTLGSAGIVARPLEFLSSVRLRVPPLEVRRKCRDSFSRQSREMDPQLEMRREIRGSS